jgi:serine O-acetyltransferase
MPVPSIDQADWSRESLQPGEWSPGKNLLKAIRDYQRLKASARWWQMPLLKWAVLRHRFWSAVSGADIPLSCSLGGGLLIPHPNGIVIHPRASIGVNCLIFQQVTIGARGVSELPTVGAAVDIGAGAKILGRVRLGDRARVGANAVVLADVEAGCSVAGVPAVPVAAKHKSSGSP